MKCVRDEDVTGLSHISDRLLQQANRRVWNAIQAELFRTNKEARIKEVTGVKFEPIDCQRLRAALRLIFQTYAA